jgi:hypothetical protein
MRSARQDGQRGGAAADRRPAASKPVGSFVPALVREACRRRGFNNVDIVLRWREIVGPALAGETVPLRIEWPRRQETVLRPDGTAEPGAQRTRLVVGSAPARTLDVEYAKREIVERVNRYLGYRAATELTAAPDYTLAAQPHAKSAAAGSRPDRPPPPTGDPLEAALSRLGQAVARRGF